jgi:CyaY protein
MDESKYKHLADDALRQLESMLDDVDAEDVDVERSGDVLTLTFSDKKKCVINTQRPTKQLWLAADARAWHFGYDESVRRWLDDKGQRVELFERVVAIIKEHAGIDVETPTR